MNDPRKVTTVESLTVESFVVNDERALHDEVEISEHLLGWDKRTADERAAMASLVRVALLRLAEDVESWLPEAAVAASDQSFGFFVWWKNRHLDDEILTQRSQAEEEIEARLAELRRIAGGRHEPDCS